MNISRTVRYSTIALGALLLATVGTAAASAEENYGDSNVDVNVEIAEVEEPGVLAMTVAGSSSVQLTEAGSTDLVRQFTGSLPTVTVTDTRDAGDVPAGASWYVMGTASDFVSADESSTIGAENLGWSPALVQGAGAGEEFISVGGDVDTKDEGGTGLVDQELLYLADSVPANGGAWSATAGLTLRVPADVEPGAYSSVLTLSLFE
jgi:hypothetical protein